MIDNIKNYHHSLIQNDILFFGKNKIAQVIYIVYSLKDSVATYLLCRIGLIDD